MKSDEPTVPEETDALAAFLEQEGVQRGARLLDVPCGIGRRAVALAKAGFDVVAIDSNDVVIVTAQKRVPDEIRTRLAFAASPRDGLPGLLPHETFDAILCLDHALARGSVQEVVGLLTRLARHAKDEGRLIVDLLNRDYIASRPRPFAFHVIGNVEQHEFRRFDPTTGIMHYEWKFYERVGNDLKSRTTSTSDLRLIPPHAVEELLAQTGWHAAAMYGGWDRTPVRVDRRKFVVVARPARNHVA